MTDPGTADRTYIGPMTPELVEEIIAKVLQFLHLNAKTLKKIYSKATSSAICCEALLGGQPLTVNCLRWHWHGGSRVWDAIAVCYPEN